MSVHCGYIVQVKELRPHTNADKLQVVTFFGNDTIVDLSVQPGDIGVYFPVDLQLSEEYCAVNNLVRKKDENGNNVGGFLDPEKRNIKAIKLRGEKSDGLFMPLASFSYCYDQAVTNPDVPVVDLSVGDQVTVLNGHEICKKYIPKQQSRVGNYSNGNHTRKTKVSYAPLFTEHADTEQLAYNLGAFKPGDEIEITLKMHGTSQRTGYLPVLKEYNFPHKFRHLVFKIFSKKEDNIGWLRSKILEWSMKDISPIYDWGGVSGTRRVVLEDYVGGFYGSNAFREQHSKVFDGKLMKGETVYYEVVGFTDTGAPIMATASNKKLNDKEFVKQYGEETVFSYGCSPCSREEQIHFLVEDDGPGLCDYRSCIKPQSDIYVYRMTMTNEDGFVVEYTPDFMRYRCEQMGVKTVPVLWKGSIPESLKTEDFFTDDEGNFKDWVYAENAGEWIKNIVEQYYDGPDPIGKTHIREGVVIRIINRPKFCAYKHKNHDFKVLEGLIKEEAVEPDMEEIQEVEET